MPDALTHTPILTVRKAERSMGISGMSPYTPGTPEAHEAFRQGILRHGHVILTDDRHTPDWNHRVSGIGGDHDDAAFSECRQLNGSMVAWYENDSHYDPAEIIARRARKGDR
jgi:hypothetical protein